MTTTEFELLRSDLLLLRADVDRHFAEVEAKLDAKPTVAVLYQAVVTMMFGIGAVVTSTVVVLKNLGLMG
jgi:hypothetical protein